MDFNEILIDIILNEKHDGDKDIDWLYGEYVKRGYNKSREMFCEEFVMSMNEQEIKYLTESEVNKVTGGAGKFKKSSTSIALASALLAGSMMPTQGAGVPESRAVVSDSISNKHQRKSNQGFYGKATGILNKIFNEADVRNILAPVLATVGVPVLGASTIYLIIRIVKRISEAETPDEILNSTAKGINDILNNKQSSNKKDGILTLLKICLLKLINFVTKEPQSELEKLYVAKFGTEDKPTEFNNWEEIQEAFTEVLNAINKKLEMQSGRTPLNELFEDQKDNFKTIFGTREVEKDQNEDKKSPEPQEESPEIIPTDAADNSKDDSEYELKKDPEIQSDTEPQEDSKILEDPEIDLQGVGKIFDDDYDVDMAHDSYTTEQLKDNTIVSQETGINKTVLAHVDQQVEKTPAGKIATYDLPENTKLIVCKDMDLGLEDLQNKLQMMGEPSEPNSLYLVLQNCIVTSPTTLSVNTKVLDLRGSTYFESGLSYMNSVAKVLLRNHDESGTQLHLYKCQNVGEIYQLSEDNRVLDAKRLFISTCTLSQDFKFVNLNGNCTKILTKFCMWVCRCKKETLDVILRSFGKSERLDTHWLEGV